MKDKVDLSVIIVSYNNKKIIDECLLSIKNSQTKYNFEVIIHDNGSPDKTAEYIENYFIKNDDYFWLRLIKGENVGFARGNNTAIKKSNGQFILLLNPDTVVQADTFEVMLDLMNERKEIGMASCKVVLPNGKLDKACRRSFPTPWVAFTRFSGLSKLFSKSSLFNRYNLEYLDPNEEYEVDAVVGAFQLTRREVIEKIGLLDERFFMYGEDIDWCFRSQQAGFITYYYPKTEITHFKSYSAKMNPLALYWFHKAMILFYKKHYEKKYPWFLNIFIYTSIKLRYLFKRGLSRYSPPEHLK